MALQEKPIYRPITHKLEDNDDTLIMKKFIHLGKSLQLPDQFTKIKKCTCSVNQRKCDFHQSPLAEITPKRPATTTKKSPRTLVESTTEQPQTKDYDKDEIFKRWLKKKQHEKKSKETNDRFRRELQVRQKAEALEKERENFREWYKNKKKQEMEKKKEEMRKQEATKLKELEKEKRQLENILSYKAWLKKKEEVELEKKIKEQTKLIKEMEEKERKEEENRRAFDEWMKKSKHKPKPVPLNQGLDSLRFSKSVSYINHVPWKPNIETPKNDE